MVPIVGGAGFRLRGGPLRGAQLRGRTRQPGRWSGLWSAGQRIGILGGSFNPAHDGHVHISRQAALALGLDAVWWLVSPGNPLKDPREYRSLDTRIEAARTVADQSFIQVSDIETVMGTRRTADTLRRLKAWMPRTHFVWIMGADNLESFSTWHQWSDIFQLCPIAVVGRPAYSIKALNSKASIRFRPSRREARSIRGTWHQSPLPLWTFVFCRLHPASSTNLRRNGAPPP